MDHRNVHAVGGEGRPAKLWLAAVCLGCGFAVPGAVVAEDPKAAGADDLPKAEVILDRMVEALGGKATFEKIHNRVIKATFEISGMRVKAPLTIYQAGPNSEYVVLEAQTFGKIEEGVHNGVAWRIGAKEGARLRQGKERDGAIHLARFNRECHWRELYTQAKCDGIEDVDGQPCYKLTLTPTVGKPEQLFIAQNTHLLLGWNFSYITAVDTIPFEMRFSEYTVKDGVQIPYRTQHKVLGTVRVVTIESVKHNVDLDEDFFEPPPEIKEKLEAAEKGTPTAKPSETR